MPVDTLLVAAFELLILGMGSVFVILGLLIGCMTLLSRLAPPEKQAAMGKNIEAPVIAAIQTAIHQYRHRHLQKTTA